MIQINVDCMNTDFKVTNNYNKITFIGSMNLGVCASLELQLTDVGANALRLALKTMPLVYDGIPILPKHPDVVCNVPCRVYYKDALGACIKQAKDTSLRASFLSRMGVNLLISPIRGAEIADPVTDFDDWYTGKSVIQLFLITDYSAKLIEELDKGLPFHDRNDPVNIISEKYISSTSALSVR